MSKIVNFEKLRDIHDRLQISLGPSLADTLDTLSDNYKGFGNDSFASDNATEGFNRLSQLIQNLKDNREEALNEFNAKYANYINSLEKDTSNTEDTINNSSLNSL